MKNSAHDDISIIDSSAIDHIHDANMRKIYQLIEDMQSSVTLGVVHSMRQNVKLKFKAPQEQDDLFVYFQTNMVISEGWLTGPLGSFFSDEQSDNLTQADIEAIRSGNFEMQIDVYSETDPMSFTELLNQMDVFEAGRPSTVAGIIENLVEKGLISLSKEGDMVQLTPEGRDTHQALQNHLATIANVEWNSWLMSQLSQIESGDREADDVLLNVLETLYGKQAADSFKHLSWSDPNVLYEQQPTSSNIGKIAIVRKESLEQDDDLHI